jgi:hypothetical protein
MKMISFHSIVSNSSNNLLINLEERIVSSNKAKCLTYKRVEHLLVDRVWWDKVSLKWLSYLID